MHSQKFELLNIRYFISKVLIVNETITDRGFNVLCLTEMCIRPNEDVALKLYTLPFSNWHFYWKVNDCKTYSRPRASSPPSISAEELCPVCNTMHWTILCIPIWGHSWLTEVEMIVLLWEFKMLWSVHHPKSSKTSWIDLKELCLFQPIVEWTSPAD